ncbi:hypothetical protein [Variovorax sp. YR752]|uniref:hypothetical protein n=1 Tax=Variovorax sp. YR752 TaxID=1884383 RepID=UPI0031381058
MHLVTVNLDGTRGRVLASTTTGTEGNFSIDWPAGRSPDDTLALESIEADGAIVRALALGTSVDVGTASELVTRVYLEARRTAGGRFTEPVERLHRWQTATTIFLTLTSLRQGGDTEARLIELRRWLDADPASQSALSALRRQARLPASLGDIGGLLGANHSAWEVDDSSRGRYQIRVLPAPEEGADFGAYRYAADADGALQSRPRPLSLMRFRNDMVDEPRAVVPPGAGANEEQLRLIVGPLTFAAIGVPIGETRQLMNTLNTITSAPLPSAFPAGTTILTESTTTADGIESVKAFGQTLRALRTTLRENLVITTPDGRRLESTGRRTDWSVPFAGAVRSSYTSRATASGGEPATVSGQLTLLRGVSNEVSWPGRVRLSARSFEVPNDDRFWHPLGVGADRNLVFTTTLADDEQLSALVIDVDTGARKALKVFDPPADRREAFTKLSPDGRKLYAVQSVALPMPSSAPIALATADAAGALIERFDAGTLVREMSMRLPARRSTNRPGLGLPRSEVYSMLISPQDATEFATATLGAVLVRGTDVLPEELFDASAEYASGVIIGGSVILRRWDGIANEIHADVAARQGAPVPMVVPVRPQGIPLAGARPGFSPALALGGSIYDWGGPSLFTDELLYYDAFGAVFDKRTGALLGRGDFGGSVLGTPFVDASRCALALGSLTCLDAQGPGRNSRLHRLSTRTLATIESIDLQANLRLAVGQQLPTAATTLGHVGGGELVASEPTTRGYPALLFSVTR